MPASKTTSATSSSPSSSTSPRSSGWLRMMAPAALVLLAACGAKDGAPPAGAAPKAPPPPEVGVVTVEEHKVALQTELPGRVEAVRVAQVRARVNGVVQKRLFREGSEVKAGQPLFQIDAAPYRAQVESAQATVARAQANLTQAAAQAERFKPLVEANAISKQDYLNAVAAQKQAEADVAGGKAALETSRINLGYANVTAPIAGRIGRALVTEGALVSAAEATQLALIQQTSTVYVNFTQSSTDVLKLRRAVSAGQVKQSGDGAIAVRVVLEDGSEVPRSGKLLFSDLSVDATSGQITLRAEVPNPDGILLPGQYVRVRLSQAELPSGILLPQQAVTRTNQGDSVIVVGDDGKPAPRPVKIGSAQGTSWLVLSGVKPGEKVIVEGFQKMMVPGAPVKPMPWSKAASGATAAASGAAPAASSSASAAAAPTAASAASAQ
jgi:membrane fusion protein (multidrug efflux system)